MKKQKICPQTAYVSPEVEFIDIVVESCFAESEASIEDMTEEDWDW